MNHPPTPRQRVSAISFPGRYDLPARPEGAPADGQDAHRQTTFLLGDDLRLFEEGMNLQLRIVRDASPSAFRKHPYAALMGLWSRAFLALTDGCLLATRGTVTAQYRGDCTDLGHFVRTFARTRTQNAPPCCMVSAGGSH